MEIGPWTVYGTALAILFEENIDAVGGKILFSAFIVLCIHDEGMMNVVVLWVDLPV